MPNGDDIRKLAIEPKVREALAEIQDANFFANKALNYALKGSVAKEPKSSGYAASDALETVMKHPELEDRLAVVIGSGINRNELHKLIQQAVTGDKEQRDNMSHIPYMTNQSKVDEGVKLYNESVTKLIPLIAQGIDVAIDQAVAPGATPKTASTQQRQK